MGALDEMPDSLSRTHFGERPGFLLRLLAGFLLLALSVVSAIAVYRETRPFMSDPRDPSLVFAAIVAGQTSAGFSTYSQKLVLDQCLTSMTSIFGRVQPSAKRNVLLSRCSDIAIQFVHRSPSFSYAWLIAAFASAEMGNVSDLNERLRMSQVTGPYELWLSELRLPLAIRYKAMLSREVVANSERDILVHLLTDRGAKQLAGRMLRDQDLSEAVIAVTRSLPENIKWRLVQHLEDVAGQVGSGK